MDIIRILMICLIAGVLAVILKQQKPEYSLFISIVAGVIIIGYIIKTVYAPIEIIKNGLAQYGIESECFKVAFKALLIGYVTGFIADTCRDGGQTALAGKAEFAGKCAIFILSVPLAASVLETALGFIK